MTLIILFAITAIFFFLLGYTIGNAFGHSRGYDEGTRHARIRERRRAP